MLVGATGYVRGALITIAQILGGIAASALVSAMFPGPLAVRTELGGGTTVVQGLFIEVSVIYLFAREFSNMFQMFLSAQLVFTIFMLATEKHSATFVAPIGIGLSLFIAELMGVYYTGGSVNPARSFGPCVVTHSFHGYHWIYWVGPVLGSTLAAAFYMFIKSLEYETVNLAADPKEVLGKKFDPESGKEKYVTRSGHMVDPETHEAQRISESTRVNDPYAQGPHLEGGNRAMPAPAP